MKETVEEFLARGGKIEKVKQGKTGITDGKALLRVVTKNGSDRRRKK